MLIDLTAVHAGDDRCDVRIDAPNDTPFGAVRQRLARAVGADFRARAWNGGELVDDDVRLDQAGLLTGAVLTLGDAPPRDLADAPRGALQIAVLSGPGAGRSYPLADGVTVIGRDAGCDVVLTDPGVSRRHAQITVTAAGSRIRDLGTRNGTTVAGTALGGRSPGPATDVPLRPDVPVRIGDTVLALLPAPQDAIPTRTVGDRRLVTPAARRPAEPVSGEVSWPADGQRARPATVAWLTVAVPALAGGAFAWFTHNVEFLAFALLTPVIAVAQTTGDRMSWRRSRRRTRQQHTAEENLARTAVDALLSAETAQRRAAHPDPVRVLATARLPGLLLWSRDSSGTDALHVRIGTCARPSAVRIRRGSSCGSAGILYDVPAVVDLATGALGLAGPTPRTRAAAAWLIGQLTTALPPSRLRIIAWVDPADEAWQWLRWLPHLEGMPAHDSAAAEAVRRAEVIARLTDRVTDTRRSSSRPGRWTVLLVDRSAREVPGLTGLLGTGPRAGITAVVTAESESALPTGCAAVATVSGETGAYWSLTTPGPIPAGQGDDDPQAESTVLGDAVDEAWPEALARALAGFHEAGGPGSAAVPSEARLLDLLALPDPTPAALLDRWAAAEAAAQTPIGVTSDGPLVVDLAADGPHALIAGTTGAGKSELLQTLVAGLAATHAPAHLGFVLIDYKGGAAFAECARLPHTVAIATDLDESLTRRALQSLDAELRRRERELARHAAASLDALARVGVHPFGRLVLVVDEFAALARDLPDFLHGLVGIAQRGRSLGVHLVLATQRPAGVVSPEIRANTALRIALRTTDAGESLDVVGDDRAAALSRHNPGRAIVRTGTRVVEMQSARVTAPAPVTTELVTVVPLDSWRAAPRTVPDPGAKTDLAVLVAAAREAALSAEQPLPSSPWLPPLPDRIPVRRAGGGGMRVVYGRADVPSAQRQDDLVLDVGGGDSLLLVGGRRSGKTTVLRAIAACAAQHLSPDDLHLYVLDFAGGALGDLDALSHCGAFLGPDDLAEVGALADALLDGVRAEQDAGPGDLDAVPARLVVVDGWDRLVAASEESDGGRTAEKVLALLQCAGADRVSAVVSSERAALSGRLPRIITQKAVLPLTEASDISLAGVPIKAIPVPPAPGRALLWGTDTVAQLAMIGSPDSQPSVVRGIAAAAGRAGERGPLIVRRLPRRVRLHDLPRIAGRVVLGVGGRAAEPIQLDLAPGSRVLVAGPDRSGRSTALATVLCQLAGVRQCLVIAGRRSPLTPLATTLGLPTVAAPSARPSEADLPTGTVVLVDDCEALLDSSLEAALLEQLRVRGNGLAVIAAGRSSDLAVTFRGLGAELRKARCGILLTPGRGDGELLGLRLGVPAAGSTAGPGRGVATLADVMPAADKERFATPCAIQVALP